MASFEKRATHWNRLHADQLAPALISAKRISHWYMYVGEWLEDPWQRLDHVLDELRKEENDQQRANLSSLFQALLKAVGKMHELNLVHGDLRAINIMVQRPVEVASDWNVRFIDLDWMGEDGAVTYPPDINVTSVQRPEEVVGGGVILKQHDLSQVKLIFSEWPQLSASSPLSTS